MNTATDLKQQVDELRANLQKPRYRTLKASIIEGVILYVVAGVPVGSFLEAVITNDLKEACGRADDLNRYHLFDIVSLLYNEVPMKCWGSPAAYVAWVRSGGLKGHQQEAGRQDGTASAAGPRLGDGAPAGAEGRT